MSSVLARALGKQVVSHSRKFHALPRRFPTVCISPRLFVGRLSSTMSFNKFEVVPDVLAEAPAEIAMVQYAEAAAKEGNELTPTLVQNAPTVTWKDEPEKLYTVALVDPDAPSRAEPTYREWRHWLVYNVPGSGKVAEGDSLFGYVGAGPPEGTGLHRYVVLVYQQPDRITVTETPVPSTSTKGRPSTHIKDFVEQHKLQLQAGNFFQAQWDDFVPKLYASFTD